MKKTITYILLLLGCIGGADAQFLVTPKEGEATKIEGNVTFSKDEARGSWSLGESFDSSLELSKIEKISLYKDDELKIGDYYYSDGTWSTTLDSSKTPIGVVFYVGDPSVSD